MPIYEYECTKCGHRFEKIQKFSDPQVRTCPECKGKVQRLVHAPAIQFKGSGWYVTDYAGKSGGGGVSVEAAVHELGHGEEGAAAADRLDDVFREAGDLLLGQVAESGPAVLVGGVAATVDPV